MLYSLSNYLNGDSFKWFSSSKADVFPVLVLKRNLMFAQINIGEPVV